MLTDATAAGHDSVDEKSEECQDNFERLHFGCGVLSLSSQTEVRNCNFLKSLSGDMRQRKITYLNGLENEVVKAIACEYGQ